MKRHHQKLNWKPFKRKLTNLKLKSEFQGRSSKNTTGQTTRNACFPHWTKEHTKVRQTVQELEGYIETLVIEVRKTMEKGEAQARRHSTMIHKLNYDHKQEHLQHRREALMIQEEHIKYNKRKDKKHLEEAQDKDRTVAYLRQALEMEQKALLKHLQAEREKMVNPMLFGNGSRMIE